MDKSLQTHFDSYKELLSNSHQIVGIGVTAFNRITPAFFNPNYQIVCYKEGSDSPTLKKLTTIKSIQQDFSEAGDIDRLNTLSILSHKGVQDYLNNLPQKPKILLYKTTERVDKICNRFGWQVLANKSQIRDRFEDKDEFFRVGRDIGLPMIKGKQIKLNDLDESTYERLTKHMGDKLVFQVVDFSKGGGRGTFFINSYNDISSFKQKVKIFAKDMPEKEWKTVNVTQFISGPSPSITGCATKHGILTSPVQIQILDVKELLMGREPGGVYQGHDWSLIHYDSNIQKQAENIAKTLGEYMYSQGYKGIFGVDLAVDQKTQKVYPVECNPRYTGAFPVYSMIQMDYGEIPLDVFQLLELLELDYEMDFKAVDDSWKTPKEGSHFALQNPFLTQWTKTNGDLPAGVYKISGNKLKKVRDGVLYQDIKNKDEFALTDGPPSKDQLVNPGFRCGKLIFRRGVLAKQGELNQFAKKVVEAIYKGFNFIKVENKSD